MALASTAADTRGGRILETGAGGVTSAVSWGAIIGGAFVIASVGLLLMALGAGFGLASVSPWPNSGVTATTFGVMTAIMADCRPVDFVRFGRLYHRTAADPMDRAAHR